MEKIPDYDRYTKQQRQVALDDFKAFFAQVARPDCPLVPRFITDDSDLAQLHVRASCYRQTMETRALVAKLFGGSPP